MPRLDLYEHIQATHREILAHGIPYHAFSPQFRAALDSAMTEETTMINYELLEKYNRAIGTMTHMSSDDWNEIFDHAQSLDESSVKDWRRVTTKKMARISDKWPVAMPSSDFRSIRFVRDVRDFPYWHIDSTVYMREIRHWFSMAGRLSNLPLPIQDLSVLTDFSHRKVQERKLKVPQTEITKKTKKLNKIEEGVSKEIKSLLKIRNLPVSRFRKLIDRVYMLENTYGEVGKTVQSCIICTSYRNLTVINKDQRVCRNCVSILENNVEQEEQRDRDYASRGETPEESTYLMNQRMLRDEDLLSYSTRVPTSDAKPLAMGVEIELEWAGSTQQGRCRHTCDDGCLCDDALGCDNANHTDNDPICYQACRHDCIDDGCIRSGNSPLELLESFVDKFGTRGILKEDGSLDKGAEFVTRPMGRSDLEKVVTEYGNFARENNFEAKATCGMHIHVNREGFTDQSHQFRFAMFFKQAIPDEFLRKYVGDTRFNRQIKEGGGYASQDFDICNTSLNEYSKLGGSSRYTMVSFYPDFTIELRFFASSTNPGKLRANIQFAIAVREYTRHHMFPEWATFVHYIQSRPKKYPDFNDRITRFSPALVEELV